MTLRDLYLRVAAAIAGTHTTVKADVDAAFADHEAALNAPAAVAPPSRPDEILIVKEDGAPVSFADGTPVQPVPFDPAPLTIVPAVDLGDAPEPTHGDGA